MINFRKTHRIYHEVLFHPGGEVENVITKTSCDLSTLKKKCDLRSTTPIFVISTLWTDLVVGVAAREAYIGSRRQ